MYEKMCYKSSTLKDDKSNSNVNIYKILHLPFDMLFYSIDSIMCGAKCTDNWLVARKDQWFGTARLVQRNNDCVMCFCILWY